MQNLNKKSILKKTGQVGILSILSKILGIIRDIMQIQFLGVGALSDAFSIAWRIPNALRKVFAEGALTSSTVPTLVKLVKEKEIDKASKLTTLILLSVSAFLLIICILIAIYPEIVIKVFAPGFYSKSVELNKTISLIRILIFFIFFVSLSSILTSAMQAKQNFFIPALGPVLLNIFYILGLLISLRFGLTIESFSLFIILGSIFQLFIFYYNYKKLNFSLKLPDKSIISDFKQIIFYKFLPVAFSISILEINLSIDAIFGSFLPSGSITLINLASRFMGIALSSFAAAFSSILLSHLSHVTTYAPKRLSFYVLECTKFLFWAIIPITLLISFFSYDIFYTTFFKFTNRMTLEQVSEASLILIGFTTGLFFLSLNRIFLSIYYAIHQTFLPTIISVIGALANLLFNWLFISKLGAFGIAIATTISAIIQSFLFVIVLNKKYKHPIYFKHFLSFLMRYFIQLSLVSIIFYILYKLTTFTITNYLPNFKPFLLNHIGLWLWVGPLVLIMFGILYFTRNFFKIKLYFLD